jgi:hypothetical protein
MEYGVTFGPEGVEMHGIRGLVRGTAMAAVVLTGSLVFVGPQASAASRNPQWASSKSATIHPGVSVSMGGVTCRAGFVFTDGTHVFIAVPASCSGAGPVDNSKCDAGQDPVGTPVTIQGAKHKGTLVYSSIITMELRGGQRTNRCAYNDLSLVRIDRSDIKRTNPSVPVLGGPTGVSKDQPAAPDQLSVYATTASNAQALQTTGGGWSHSMMVDGAVSGTDIGAPALTAKGQALGMVSGVPSSEGQTLVNDLLREVRYLHSLARFADVHLAKGTEKFTPMLALGSA